MAPSPGRRDRLLPSGSAIRLALEGTQLRRPPETSALLADAMPLDRLNWEHLHRVLMECDWNVSEAARRLGIHRQSLQRKLRQIPALRERGNSRTE